MHAGDLIAEMLVRSGTDWVFGQPGGQTAAFYDGLQRRADSISHMLVRDERSAAYAADAYARLTGRPGVCDVTVGPGTTKLTDGLVESLNASVPVVAIVGELPRDWLPLQDHGVASQGFDQLRFLQSVTKAAWMVPSSASLPHLMRAAWRCATSGRPGPVALIVPHDVMDAEWEAGADGAQVDDRYLRAPALRPSAPPADLRAAADLLGRARRPILVAGGGVLGSRATEELGRLAETVDATVVTSFSGKGAIAETGPHGGGVLNPLAGPAAREMVLAADLVMWVGCKVSQNTSVNWTLPTPEQATIHLDLDPIELGRTFRPTVALCGDARSTLAGLLELVEPAARPEWAAQVRDIAAEHPAQDAEEAAQAQSPVAPAAVMQALAGELGETDVVISDASFSAGWVSTYLPARRAGRSWLFARGMGGLGYAVPAALGAAVARPDDRVVTVNGDGGFSYAIGELATHAQQGLNTVHVVLNNGTLGWLQMWQQIFFDGLRKSVDLKIPDGRPDYAAAARAMGCAGIRVEDPQDLREGLRSALDTEGPAVLEVLVDATATPLPSFRRRLSEAKEYPRPGTTYGLRDWSVSPELMPAAPIVND